MKRSSLFFAFFVPFFCFGQVNDSFTDGNFTVNPTWTGATTNFFVNKNLQLQSQSVAASTSALFTPSEAFDDAIWEFWVKITYTTSSSNYAAVYLTADKNNITDGCNAYFVQVGGTNDEVSLFVQEGTKKTKIIDGTDKRTDGNPVELRVKVTRDAQGEFSLYSKLPAETNFVLEGTAQNTVLNQSSFIGLLYSNTSTTGSNYYFDEIVVTGHKAIDLVPPVWTLFSIENPNKLILGFSEAMDFSSATFTLDQGMGNPGSQTVWVDNKSITLDFSTNFEKGKIYTLTISKLADLGGNPIALTVRSIGITESIEIGDLVFNEVMFENPDNSLEYLEIYNKSDKVLDVSGLVFTTRKTDGTLNTGNDIPGQTLLLPQGYLALCSDAEKVRNYHACPAESNVMTTAWSSLNNESATLVLTNQLKDTIYDELTYSNKWHHILVRNPKGVALERINSQLPTQSAETWHSAGSEVIYGTPGYRNSQYRDVSSEELTDKFVWVEPESFTPDNDGVDDVCLIHYKTENSGFVANAIILNAVGVKVYQLASNILLSGEGFLSWDGRTSVGKNANVGIYVLYFEMFNAETGVRKKKKLPIVVSSR